MNSRVLASDTAAPGCVVFLIDVTKAPFTSHHRGVARNFNSVPFDSAQRVFTARLHAVQRTVLLSQFCLSLCQMRVL